MSMEISQLNSLFTKIYGTDPKVLEKQLTRYEELARLFREKFGDQEVHFFSTPGRTEIGGNHTDHNHGRVLAGSINLDSIAIASRNGSKQVSVYSMGYDNGF